MPIYEFSCPKCRVIFNFFSRRVAPGRVPACPRCGRKRMEKQISNFAMIKGAPPPGTIPGQGSEPPGGEPMPDFDDPKVMRAMSEIERDIDRLDENNPKHLAHLMKKMKDALPPGSMPGELDTAIKRLEQGEDPEKIEADMGDVLGDAFGSGDEDGGGGSPGPGGYSRDSNLYEY